MVTKSDIQGFLQPRRFAIAGVSRNPKKFGRMVYNDLKKQGYILYPINPNLREIEGEKVYSSVEDLPADVNHLFIATAKKDTDGVLRQAIQKGILNVWVQQMSETPDTLKIAAESNVQLISKKCIYMFADPVKGVHKFHRCLMRIFGRLPK
jgi:predicted CoA-binding protein